MDQRLRHNGGPAGVEVKEHVHRKYGIVSCGFHSTVSVLYSLPVAVFPNAAQCKGNVWDVKSTDSQVPKDMLLE